jgi:hypothetical protein
VRFPTRLSIVVVVVANLVSVTRPIPDYDEINDKPVENMTKFIRSKQEASRRRVDLE